MKLKETFRYQNILQSWIDSVQAFLLKDSNVTNVNENHQKSKANPDANDEKIVNKVRTLDVTPNGMIDLLMDLVSEKELLSKAISKAKRNTVIDIDSALEINKSKQSILYSYERLNKIKSSESKEKNIDYKFNAEGNQTTYYYPVEKTVTIDFDRDKVRALIKKLKKDINDTSLKIEEVMINHDVDFTSKYDIDTSFDELIEPFKPTEE